MKMWDCHAQVSNNKQTNIGIGKAASQLLRLKHTSIDCCVHVKRKGP